MAENENEKNQTADTSTSLPKEKWDQKMLENEKTATFVSDIKKEETTEEKKEEKPVKE